MKFSEWFLLREESQNGFKILTVSAPPERMQMILQLAQSMSAVHPGGWGHSSVPLTNQQHGTTHKLRARPEELNKLIQQVKTLEDKHKGFANSGITFSFV